MLFTISTKTKSEEVAVYYDIWTAILPIALLIFYALATLALIFIVIYFFKRLNRSIKNQEKLIHLLQERKRKP